MFAKRGCKLELGIMLTALSKRNNLLVFLIVVTLFTTSNLASYNLADAQLGSDDQFGVHEYLNSPKFGNITFIDDPIYPIFFNSSEIPIGQNWTISCPLLANHSYHIYIYGSWINTTSTAKTDYNVYVYDPQGNLESTHTEAAGLPEHLGSTFDDPYFVPQSSGNYTFLIVNDPKGSKGEQAATFMIIENVQCDKWYTQYIEGKDWNAKNSKDTLWACDFVSNSSYLEVWIKVPDTLDMYECRLYTMNAPSNSSSLPTQKQNGTQLQSLNGVPLPWEPGLYGNTNGSLGGYNFESEAFRGVAYASCETMGQDMYLNYSLSSSNLILYHLAFIGQTGSGDIEFLIKTQFNDTDLTPLVTPHRGETGETQLVSYFLNGTKLEKAVLNYTNDEWNHSSILGMQITNNTCSAVIPPQAAGSLVEYEIQASDNMENSLFASGNFTVKNNPTLNITATENKLELGHNITINGNTKFSSDKQEVTVRFLSTNDTQDLICTPNADGKFVATFCPKTTGDWIIQAFINETETTYRADAMTSVNVYQTFLSKNSFAIGGTAIALVAVAFAVLVLKSRNR
jgi:hypothetical protein